MRHFKYKVRAAQCAVVIASAALPVAAFAQTYFSAVPAANAQRQLADPPGVDEGLPWGLYGSIGISVAHNSNVRSTSTNPQSDTAIIVPASLTYKQRFGRHKGHVRVSTALGKYDKFSTEDFKDYSIDGALLFDFTRRLDAGLFARYTEASEQRGGSGSPIFQPGDRNKVEILTYGGDVFYGRRDAKMYVGGGVIKDEWRYTNNNQNIRDRDNEGVFARVGYRVGPKTDAFLEGRHTEISYLQSPVNVDSDEDLIAVGVGWRPTAATSGTVKVGRLKKDFDDPARADTEHTVYAANVDWRPRQRHGFRFSGSRSVEEGLGLSSYFVSDALGARWNYDFRPGWLFHVFGTYIEDDYETGRKDEITEYGVGLNKSLTSWLSIVLTYSHIERDSNFPGASYDTNLWSIGLNANGGWGGEKLLLGPGTEEQSGN